MLDPVYYIGICLGSVLLTLYGKWKNLGILHFGAKFLASLCFIALALERGGLNSLYGKWILAALILSLSGDLFLVSKERIPFLSGLVLFLLAHLAYVGAFVSLDFDLILTLRSFLFVALCTGAIGWWIIPRTPKRMKLPVSAYFLAITSMMATALSLSLSGGSWIYATGGALFCASDVAVARERFISQTIWNPVAGLPIYYGAQLILALSIGV